MLCNACGARYLAKNKQAIALEGWMPGCRNHHVHSTMPTRHVDLSQHSSRRASAESSRYTQSCEGLVTASKCLSRMPSTGSCDCGYPPAFSAFCRDVGCSKRVWQHLQADSSGASGTSKDTTEDFGAEYSSKKARLVSCRVYEVSRLPFQPHST